MELDKEPSKEELAFEQELINPTQNTLEKMKYVNYTKIYDKEYGIYHFRIPNPLLRKASFDCSGEPTLWAKSISHEYTIFYKPIPAPGPYDWLMNHKEYGQTFMEYRRFGFHEINLLKGSKNGIKQPIKKEVIYIAPLFYQINPSFDENFITSIIVFCQSYFHDMNFRLLRLELNNKGIEYRKYEDGTYQLNACTIIEKLYKKMPEDAYCLIGITDVDLYNDVRVIKPRKWIYYPPPYKNDFCYELNSYKYWVSLCSIARFDPMFAIDEQPSEEEKAKFFFKLVKRSIKMVVKNIGHMFGLKNCIFFSCVMNGFGSMKEFDSRPVEVCPCCLRKIFTNIVRKYFRLDDGKRVTENDILIFQRFDKIKKCLQENFKGIFDRELEWYEKRYDSLNKELFGQ